MPFVWQSSVAKKKNPMFKFRKTVLNHGVIVFGGEGGIRTHVTPCLQDNQMFQQLKRNAKL
jgi:hypothetical protein